MPPLHPGRFAAQIEGSFVVFLIGLRINRPLAIHKWLPTAQSMGPMLQELFANPSLGLLGAHSSVYWPGVMVTQYWRSFDHLVDYAQSINAAHLPAWKAFNQRVGNDGTVGIWHETYKVEAGHSEGVYVNMPRFGLAAAAQHVPAIGALRDARSRMK
jgi:hypothetical protein